MRKNFYKKSAMASLLLLFAMLASMRSHAQAPMITTDPMSTAACTGGTATFTVSASDTPTSYTWYVSTDGGMTFSPISDDTIYSGSSTATLSILTNAGLSGDMYEATATNGSGTSAASASATLTVNALPDATISGATSVCLGSTITLMGATAGGSWSSSDGATASIDPTSGVVTGNAVGGPVTITYSVTDPVTTCSDSSTYGVMVNAVPDPTISGATMLCAGTTISLSVPSADGTWSVSDSTVATIDPASGMLTGVGAGITSVYYNVTDSTTGCSNYGSYDDTVNALPDATISGATGVCVGSTITLTDATTGGTWSSSDGTTASIDPASGMVSGNLVGGPVTITYDVTDINGCSNNGTYMVSVNALPDATISGATAVCVGANITLTDATTGGTWSSGDMTIATVDPTSGMVTGVAGGPVTISYMVTDGTTGCSNTGTYGVTVNALPDATISGATGVCVGSTITLTDATAGGTWSSSDGTTASIDPASGMVSGNLVGGPVTITYNVTDPVTTCSNSGTYMVTVNPLPDPTISGATAVCVGSTITLADATTGGTWSSSDTTVATIDPSMGVVTGIAGGSITVTYNVTDELGCSNTGTYAVTVNALPDATISGPTAVCAGSMITLTDATTGGTWSSSDMTIATVDLTSGMVTGVAGGPVTISYLVTDGTTGCSNTGTYGVTVNALPDATITGPSGVCIGSTITLTDATTGGTWSSSDGTIAPIDATTGVVSGMALGAVTITYNVTDGLGCSNSSTYAVTVNPLPDATISGATGVCAGSIITLTDVTGGGAWSSSDTTIATVDPSLGIVDGLSAGIVTIGYNVTDALGCSNSSTYNVIVNPLPDATISGLAAVCSGSTITLTDATAGGTWTSSAPTVAAVDPSTGVVTGAIAGAATISYNVTDGAGCSSSGTYIVTVNPLPDATISGATAVCSGSTTMLTDATSGGTWSSSDGTIASIDPASGLVTGVTTGAVTITYNVADILGCSNSATYAVTVNPLPDATISGPSSVCVASSITLTDATAGGAWSSTDITIASVDSSAGTVTGIAAGSVTISYSVTDELGCSNSGTYTVTVNPLPDVTISGSTGVCVGSTISLADATPGGSWSTSDATIASVDESGNVMGVAAGMVTISYMASSELGCSATGTYSVTVNALPDATITGPSTACTGTTVFFSDATPGGTWSSSDPTTVAIDSVYGNALAYAEGTVTISYAVTSEAGCSNSASTSLAVGPLPVAILLPAGSATMCGGTPVTLSAASTTEGETFQWYIDGFAISTDAGVTNPYVADTPGYYTVAVSNGYCSVTSAATSVVLPPNPIIIADSDGVLYTGSFASYQWFLNGEPITGDTTSVIVMTEPGIYSVLVTDGNGCAVMSAGYSTLSVTAVNKNTVKLYPNPASTIVHIQSPVSVNVTFMSIDGKTVLHQDNATSVDIGQLADGIYMVNIFDSQNTLIKTERLVKTAN